ncbi:MAG: helix-turn-helix transcriptional regulator [Mycobacteriaceae bacterium]|nr:helix-turn-helix transcriptional regulator [Mycobacteriaceae bacterium]
MMLLAQAYCGLGRVDNAETIIVELQARSGAQDTVFRPQLRIVEAWRADSSCLQRLSKIADTLDGCLPPAYAAYGAALADHDPVALSAVSEQFEQIGAMLSAADAAAQAAAMFRSSGKHQQAIQAAGRAAQIAQACGGMHTPALLATAQPLPLTAREREITNLVAAGLTNREIADQLTLSPRTVEHHILHSCTKLGVSDRKALATLIGDFP